MSQAGQINSASGPLPPTVATSYTTDNGTAVPAANILLVHAIDSTENNANGIIAKGGIVGTGTSNEVDIVLTNRLQATLTTTNNTPQTLLNFPLGATAGTYNFFIQLAIYDSTNNQGGAATLNYALRTNGATATKIGASGPLDVEDDNVLNQTLTDITITSNALNLEVTGALGTTINWTVVIIYVFSHI